MEKRTLLAVVLSILVIVSFQYWAAKNYTHKGPVEAAKTDLTPQKGVVRDKSISQDALPDIKPPTKEEEYLAETDRFIFTFSNIGGSIKKVELREFADKETGIPHTLASIDKPQYFIGAFNLSEDLTLSSVPYQLAKAGKKIEYVYKTDDIEIEKLFTLHNYNDYIELRITIKNKSQREIATDSRIIVGSGINATGAMAQRYMNVSAKVNGKFAVDKRDSKRAGDVSWTAINSKYFCIIGRPYQFMRESIAKFINKGNLSAGMKSPTFTLSPNSETTQQYLFYLGPLETHRIKAIGMDLEEAVNYGIFDGISKVLLNTLRFFHRILRNWGLAIIVLTILINFLLYPLTRKSYKSMKAMQELQPHIDKLRGMHKDNPQKLNKELMQLYKTYNVNPLGGCLPLLLQMPIFISLYHALMRSIELKGANFLWIKDLSKPDAVKLPFNLPFLGDSINILPILMMIAMIFQQKLSSPHKSAEMSEQQKQQQNMMLMMPIIFVVIFYTLPSGLVLYWFVNTLLMMMHQYMIKRSP